ncbi:hypothetical protein MDA_GLEAN10017927 [Myotis davidii]|uniref:Uncharacterized protein n=1 Tax=Myotis davidii TaxID=225400 RepID=L5LEQ2_MYODS|nr:hypothetical protein MDA_GLEAN10017927 [Myotis davidii]
MREKHRSAASCTPPTGDVPATKSPQSSRGALSEPIEKPVVQPVEQQDLEDPQVCGELGRGGGRAGGILSLLGGELNSQPSLQGVGGPKLLGCQPHVTLVTMTPSLPKPSSSESTLDLQPEPTVKFLFTLLSSVEPPEPKEPQEDLEILESRFLDKEDWGTQQTLKEINHLQNACMRLQESMSTIQADTVALREKLQNLPDLLYNILTEELKAVPEEGKAAQEEEQDVQEEEQAGQGTGLFQVDREPHGEW